MPRIHRRLPACLLLAALILAAPVRAQADADAGIEAAGYLIDGENALKDGEYLKAAIAYRKAAELSDNVEVAQKATQIALRLGFNEESMLAAKRWLELDPDNDEATVYYAQSHLRLGNIKDAKRAIEKLIVTGDGKADQRLLSLLPVLSDEDPQNADRLMRSLAKPYKDSALANYATAVMALQAGDSKYARQKAARAVELDPDWLKPKLVLGRALMIDGSHSGSFPVGPSKSSYCSGMYSEMRSNISFVFASRSVTFLAIIFGRPAIAVPFAQRWLSVLIIPRRRETSLVRFGVKSRALELSGSTPIGELILLRVRCVAFAFKRREIANVRLYVLHVESIIAEVLAP